MIEAERITRPSQRAFLRALDWLGGQCLPAPSLQSPLRRILLLRLEQWGDLITSLPAAALLRCAWPQARLDLVVRPEFAAWSARVFPCDRVYALPGVSPGGNDVGALSSKSRFGEWVRQFRRIPHDYDLGLEFLGDPRNILLGRSRARQMAGFGWRGGGFLLGVDGARPNPPRDFIQSHLELCRRVISTYGQPVPPGDPMMMGFARLRGAAQDNSAAVEIPAAPPWVILAPAASEPSRAWPVAHWRQLARMLLAQGETLLVTGTGAQADEAAAIMPSLPGIYNLAGKTDLFQLTWLTARARLVVAPDTGIIHLARALQVPSLGLYGPNDPAVTGYELPRHGSVFQVLPCSFCHLRKCPHTQGHGICMQWLTPAQVMDRAISLLHSECINIPFLPEIHSNCRQWIVAASAM